MRNSASLLHELWTDQGSRIVRFHLVLLLFDHGRARAAAAAGGHLGAVPRADGLAAGHALRDAGAHLATRPGQGQEGPRRPPQQQVQQDVLVPIRASCVAGRLGLPALSGDARLESVDAMAAAVVAAGPLTGAALSLLLDAVLPAGPAARPATPV